MKEIRLARVKIPHFNDRLESLWLRLGRAYVLQGEIAVEVGCSLQQVEREMISFVDEGSWKSLSSDDLSAMKLDVRFVAFSKLI